MDGAVVDGVIQGKAIAARVRAAVATEAARMSASGRELTLVVVRVGDDPASEIYVRHKIKACEEAGIRSRALVLAASTEQTELLALIATLNADATVDGILVQLPLPRHIHEETVLDAVDPAKDVDGFHPTNVGLLVARSRSLLTPCTPTGVMVMLEACGVQVRGANAVVVGRSVIVGKPMGALLSRADATVTTCHRHTRDLAGEVGRADIVVVAAGMPNLVKGEWIRPGAVVIDVGMNRLADGKVCGDVEYASARARAAMITPVPGGVGPMTVAMLLWNTVLAARARAGESLASLPASPLAGTP